jgi:hypothetical protein
LISLLKNEKRNHRVSPNPSILAAERRRPNAQRQWNSVYEHWHAVHHDGDECDATESLGKLA